MTPRGNNMMDKLNKLIDKKKKDGKGLSDMEKHAKMGVVGAMKDMANEGLHEKLGGLKKATVMSDSKEGLEAGLDKAQQIVGGMHKPVDEGDDADEMHNTDMEDLEEDAGEDLDHDHEIGEPLAHAAKVLEPNQHHHGMGMHPAAEDDDSPEHAEMSEEEIDDKIKALMAHKAAKRIKA